jgi:hypothetical protein
MSDSLMYQEEHFVVLESNQPEQFLTVDELREKLKLELLQQSELPHDLQKFVSVEEQVQYLIDTSCELDVGADRFLQWYAVRLEK